MKSFYDITKPPFRVGDVRVEDVKRPKGYKHSFLTGRKTNGFIFTVSGRMRDVLGTGECIETMPGELLFMPRGTVYVGNYSEENTRIKVIQFDLSEGELPSYLSKPMKIDLPDAGELIEDFFRPLKGGSPGNPFYYLSAIYRLLGRVEEACCCLPKRFKRLAPALFELYEYSAENLPVAHYAALCNMSEVNFRVLFREYTGSSFIKYRNSLRLDAARAKLESGEYNVTEAALESGFSNLSFFIRLYKRKFGYTPKNDSASIVGR